MCDVIPGMVNAVLMLRCDSVVVVGRDQEQHEGDPGKAFVLHGSDYTGMYVCMGSQKYCFGYIETLLKWKHLQI